MCLLKTAFWCWGNLQNSVSLNCVLSLKFLTRPPQQETSISASKDSQQLWLSVQTNCLTFSYFANNCTRRQLPSKRKKEKKNHYFSSLLFFWGLFQLFSRSFLALSELMCMLAMQACLPTGTGAGAGLSGLPQSSVVEPHAPGRYSPAQQKLLEKA